MDFSWIYENSQDQYLLAASLFVGMVAMLWIFRKIILLRLKALAEKTQSDFDDLLVDFIHEINWPILVFASFYVATKSLTMPSRVHTVLDYMMLIFGTVYAVKVVSSVISYAIKKRIKREEEEDASLLRVLGRIAKVFVWLLAILLLLSNMGVNVTSLIAGLGVGGIAIAFALQKILEDIFSSFSIYFDKPFKVGDFIIVGDDLGTVQHVGLKTTRIKHLKGHELIISNRELTSSRIHNYKHMQNRRVVFSFGVVYETPVKKLKKAKEFVKEVIDRVDLAELDRVHFQAFGDSALLFEVVYYAQTSDYNEYMDCQEEINLALKEKFEKAKIEFAYPTQTVFVKK